MTSDQTIKTPEVRFDRRVSLFVRFLREAVQHMAALAGGVLSFINWFYGNAETEFPRIGFSGLIFDLSENDRHRKRLCGQP